MIGTPMELTEIAALKNQILNVTESERTPHSFVMIFDQVIDHALFDLEIQPLQLRIKQISELSLRWIENFYLVRDSA